MNIKGKYNNYRVVVHYSWGELGKPKVCVKKWWGWKLVWEGYPKRNVERMYPGPLKVWRENSVKEYEAYIDAWRGYDDIIIINGKNGSYIVENSIPLLGSIYDCNAHVYIKKWYGKKLVWREKLGHMMSNPSDMHPKEMIDWYTHAVKDYEKYADAWSPQNCNK